MEKLYTLEHVFKKYNHYVLNDINLSINKGDIVTILGESGSGKSTLLNCLAGLETIDKGKIFFKNKRIDNLTENQLIHYRKNNLGFVFQKYNLIPNLNVIENIELGKTNKKSFKIKELLKIVGLEEHYLKYPYQLSGGMQQRVSIIRAIIKNPKVLFCDEPTGALDEKNGKTILKILKLINEELKTTIIIVTHNYNISLMSDVVITLNNGSIEQIIRNNYKRPISDIRWI